MVEIPTIVLDDPQSLQEHSEGVATPPTSDVQYVVRTRVHGQSGHTHDALEPFLESVEPEEA